MEGEFMNQFAVSSSANVVTLVVIAIIYVFKKKCDHSKCKLHNTCIDVELSNSDSTDSKDDEDIQGQIEILLQTFKQKTQRRNHPGLHNEHKEGETAVWWGTGRAYERGMAKVGKAET